MKTYLKPTIALLPRQVEIRDEKRCHDMPHVVVHPACLPQLPHGCVDQGVACFTVLPRLQVAAISTPPQSLQLGVDY